MAYHIPENAFFSLPLPFFKRFPSLKLKFSFCALLLASLQSKIFFLPESQLCYGPSSSRVGSSLAVQYV